MNSGMQFSHVLGDNSDNILFADFQRTEFRENSRLFYVETDMYQALTETAMEFEHSLLSYVEPDDLFKDENVETEQQEE